MPSISRYNIDKKVEIFKQDKEFQNAIVKKAEIKISDQTYRTLAEYLLLNESFISEFTIQQLITELPLERHGKETFEFEFNPVNFTEEDISLNEFREKIAEILSLDFLPNKIYRQILYTFKYSTLKTFFRDNWQNFVPDFDILNIERSDQLKIFQESFMREFDRFSEIIDEIYNIQDVDRTPREYLNYLAQAIGYEREDEDFLFDASFRELIKNIIEIYRIKGTNFSFELFFNFLGFEAEVREFWFDKRFSDPNITSNPYTGASDRDTFAFYLTTERPTEYIPSGMRNPYSISDDDIKPTLDGNMFTYLASNEYYTPEQLMGLDFGYPDETYTFFKTNVMEFSLERISSIQEVGGEPDELIEPGEEEGEVIEEGGEEGGLSADDLEIIRLYANFLTPIFVERNIVVITRPFQDSLELIELSDLDRPDPRATHDAINNESMFHLYQGMQPKRYYWEDGTAYWRYNQPLISPTLEENRGIRFDGIKNLEPGGHFISGFHKDTFEKIFNSSSLDSVYNLIKQENPNFEQTEIYSKISNLISTTEVKITGDLLEDSNEIININEYLSLVEKGFDLYSVKNKKTISVNAEGEEGNSFIILDNLQGITDSGYIIEEIPGILPESEITEVNFMNNQVNISNELTDNLDQEITIIGYDKVKAKVVEVDKENNKIVIDKTSFKDYMQEEFNIVGNLFIKYNLFDRDLIYPFWDKQFENPEQTYTTNIFFGRGTYNQFFAREKPKTFMHNWDNNSYFEGPDQSRFNKAKVLKIEQSNEDGNSEIYLSDTKRRFDKFENFDKVNIERRLTADFVKGDRRVTNVEYSLEAAPIWTPREYEVGELVRDNDSENPNRVLKCKESYDGGDDISPNMDFFKIVKGVSELKIGYKLKKPGFAFNAKIVYIDRYAKTIFLDYPSPITTTTENIVAFSEYHNWIYLEKTIHNQNDGVFNVISSERTEFNNKEVTKLIIDGSLNSNQNEEGGFLGLYYPRRRMQDRIPFLFNHIKSTMKQKGFTNYSYEDDVNDLIVKFFSFEEDLSYNVKVPNENDWPRHGKYDPIEILGDLYSTLFDELKHFEDAFAFFQPFVIDDSYFEVKNTFYQKAQQEQQKQSNYFIETSWNGYVYDGNTFENDFAVRHKGKVFNFYYNKPNYLMDFVDILVRRF